MLANELGLSLGQALQITESPKVRDLFISGSSNMNNAMSSMVVDGGQAGGGISLGRIPISATVFAKFELVEKR